MNTDDLKSLAAKMRADGSNYSAIGKALGRTPETIRRWLNPDIADFCRTENARRAADRRELRFQNDDAYRERILKKERMRDPEYREVVELARKEKCAKQSRKWYGENRKRVLSKTLAARKSGRGKFKRALDKSRAKALECGYMPCDATVEQLEAAWNGECYLCGDSDRKLHLEHDHNSGALRGWACTRCNIALGRFNDDVNQLLAYLREAPPLPRFKGIFLKHNRWEARIIVDKKRWFLGSFTSDFDAARAYDIVASAEGRFWNLNFPEFYGGKQ